MSVSHDPTGAYIFVFSRALICRSHQIVLIATRTRHICIHLRTTRRCRVVARPWFSCVVLVAVRTFSMCVGAIQNRGRTLNCTFCCGDNNNNIVAMYTDSKAQNVRTNRIDRSSVSISERCPSYSKHRHEMCLHRTTTTTTVQHYVDCEFASAVHCDHNAAAAAAAFLPQKCWAINSGTVIGSRQRCAQRSKHNRLYMACLYFIKNQ